MARNVHSIQMNVYNYTYLPCLLCILFSCVLSTRISPHNDVHQGIFLTLSLSPSVCVCVCLSVFANERFFDHFQTIYDNPIGICDVTEFKQ